MLHQVGVSFDLYYDARKHKIKIWCLIYLSRLPGFTKSNQRGALSSGILLLGIKSNAQVLNLANTEGDLAQSIFVRPKTA